MWIKRCKLLTSAPTLLQLTMKAGAGMGVFFAGGGLCTAFAGPFQRCPGEEWVALK